MAERKDGVSDDTVSSMETFYRHLKSTPITQHRQWTYNWSPESTRLHILLHLNIDILLYRQTSMLLRSIIFTL
jgi:hypothetical protein